MIRYDVISNDSTAKSYEISTKPTSKGIYWFTIVKAHAAEQLTLRFSSDGVESLVYNIDIFGDQGVGKENEKDHKSDNNLPTSILGSKIEGYSASDTVPLIVDPVDVSTSSASLSRPSLAVKQSFEKSLFDAIHTDSVNFVASILPMPKHVTLNSMTRIEPPVGSVRGGDTVVLIKGPLFEMRLPLLVVRAVLDDKATNAGRVLEYNRAVSIFQEANGSRSGGKAKGACVPCNLRHPTAGELFQSLLARALNQIRGVSRDIENCVDTLRQLFEYFLEDHLLYPAERQAFRNRINLMRSQGSPFADEFGVYHFLRLILFVISGTPIVGVAGSETSSSKQGGGQQKKDLVVNAIGTEITGKNMHSQMREVLDLAILLLDEQAHVLFY
jgi:hypothetical protein